MFENQPQPTQKEPEDIFGGTEPLASPVRQGVNEGGTKPPLGKPSSSVTQAPPARQVPQPPDSVSAPLSPPAGQTVVEEPKKSWIRLLIIIAIVVVVAGIATWFVLQYSVLSPKSDDKDDKKESEKIEVIEEELEVVTPPPAQEIEAPVDSDNDGLTDEEELLLGTDALLSDSDADGLPDRDEVKIYKTDPLDPDTDKDGFLDGEEVKNGYDPKGKGKLYEVPLPGSSNTYTNPEFGFSMNFPKDWGNVSIADLGTPEGGVDYKILGFLSENQQKGFTIHILKNTQGIRAQADGGVVDYVAENSSFAFYYYGTEQCLGMPECSGPEHYNAATEERQIISTFRAQ